MPGVTFSLIAFTRLLNFAMTYTPSTSRPMLRAVPAMVRTAASISAAVRSGIFGLGDLFQLRARHLADLVGVRARTAALDAGAFFSRIDAGGVLVMKVKLRSL